MIPISAFIDLVNIAKALVGMGPKVITCIPADVKPDTKAGSNIYPDILVSLAMIAKCFFLSLILKKLPAANPNL